MYYLSTYIVLNELHSVISKELKSLEGAPIGKCMSFNFWQLFINKFCKLTELIILIVSKLSNPDK